MAAAALRLQGWESRLSAVIEAARHEPYALGRHDCFRVACQAVAALTGVDHWPQFAGSYATERQALVRIVAYAREGGCTDDSAAFQFAASRLFGTEPADMRLARRGDVVQFNDDDDRPHLGVCLGERTAVLGPEGLAFASTLGCVSCWRIG